MNKVRKRRKQQALRRLHKSVTPVTVPSVPASSVPIHIISYDSDHIEEKDVCSIEECFPYRDKKATTWINIDSIGSQEILEKAGSYFGVHPLIIEDISNPMERSKVEDFDEYIYMVLKMLSYQEEDHVIVPEQLSILVYPACIITFQEQGKKGDLFDSIRERIRMSKGRIRKMGTDYLAYRLVDAIVDNYFVIMEKIGDRIQELEEELVISPRPETMQSIHELKQEMLFLHKSIWPLREAIGQLLRGEMPLIQESSQTFFRDVYDHTIQIIETVETYRDMISGMLDIYLSSISFKTNEVMKVLTIIATIFIPLTFIAGVYGMNFEYFPEIKWRYGYLFFWIVNITIALSMLAYFRRKKWL